MAKPYPKEFRDDVMAVARKGQAPLFQIAADFGISESCLTNWMKSADVEDGVKPGTTTAETWTRFPSQSRHRYTREDTQRQGPR